MIRRRAVVGLSLLGAFAFCAFVAQTASAAKAVNTTTFTCVKDAKNTGDFKDAHCDQAGNPGKEEYKHELIPLNVTTEVDAANEKVTESTKQSEPAVLKGKISAGKVTIECATVKGNTEKSKQHNVEPEKGQHTFTGEAAAVFTNCAVKELTKCIVTEPIVSEGTFEGVEKLGAEKNIMGVEYKGAGGSEELFTNIEFKNKGAEKCAVNGLKFAVTGSAIGTSGPGTEGPQTNKSAGATIALTPKNEMQKLKLGSEPAEFTLIVVPTMVGGNPISITTTT
jgi:hypothetical protein